MSPADRRTQRAPSTPPADDPHPDAIPKPADHGEPREQARAAAHVGSGSGAKRARATSEADNEPPRAGNRTPRGETPTDTRAGRESVRAGRPTTDAATSARMARQRRSGTKPELALRKELHRRGLRYFVDRAPIRGQRRRADLVFPRLRVAVYVDGCFWHRCPQHATDPRNNGEWWAAKLAGNVARDRATDTALTEAGWQVIRVWEHEDAVAAADRVQAALRS